MDAAERQRTWWYAHKLYDQRRGPHGPPWHKVVRQYKDWWFNQARNELTQKETP